jgi:hypothetical protein
MAAAATAAQDCSLPPVRGPREQTCSFLCILFNLCGCSINTHVYNEGNSAFTQTTFYKWNKLQLYCCTQEITMEMHLQVQKNSKHQNRALIILGSTLASPAKHDSATHACVKHSPYDA